MKTVLDLLLVHVPKFSGTYRPYGEYMTANLLPMGTFGLADLAVTNGFKTRILHLGLEWIETGVFSPLPYLKNADVKVLAMPLHWHTQAYDVLQIAGQVKKAYPDMFIVTGGYTASYFYREILEGYPQVDAVIRGDAEKPLVEVLKAKKEERDWRKTSNFAWREGNEIRETPLTYVAGESDVGGFSYANLSLLNHWETYVKYMGMPFIWAKGLDKEDNRRYFHLGPTFFPLNIGRGCSGNCTWCGGGASAQKIVNGRSSVVFRPPEQVADTVEEAKACGYEMMHIAFDPGKTAERYYETLFPRLKNIPNIACYFESFSLPSEQFLRLFADTFDCRRSILALSPETGRESLRNQNKSFSFSNEALTQAIGQSEKLGLRVDLFFAMGIAGETRADLLQTRRLRRHLCRRFKNIGRVWTTPISMEPAAPWFLEPERFGVIATRKTFKDFVKASSPSGGGLGYYIPGYFEDQADPEAFEKGLKSEKCRYHCGLHPNPTTYANPLMGRVHCFFMERRTRGRSGKVDHCEGIGRNE